MAEYGLYGAMVRHSLPLPETILRQQQQQQQQQQLQQQQQQQAHHQQQQSDRSGRNSASGCDNEALASGGGSEANGRIKNELAESNESDAMSVSDSTAPWLLGMHKKSLEISGRLKSVGNSSSNNRSATGAVGDQLDCEQRTDSAGTSSTSAEAKKRELASSIFMSVRRMIACGKAEEELLEQQQRQEKQVGVFIIVAPEAVSSFLMMTFFNFRSLSLFLSYC